MLFCFLQLNWRHIWRGIGKPNMWTLSNQIGICVSVDPYIYVETMKRRCGVHSNEYLSLSGNLNLNVFAFSLAWQTSFDRLVVVLTDKGWGIHSICIDLVQEVIYKRILKFSFFENFSFANLFYSALINICLLVYKPSYLKPHSRSNISEVDSQVSEAADTIVDLEQKIRRTRRRRRRSIR